MRLHIVHRDASTRAAAGDLIDVHAELAGHASHGGRRGSRRHLGRRGFCRLTRAAADVDDFLPCRLRIGRRLARPAGHARLIAAIAPLSVDVLFAPRLVGGYSRGRRTDATFLPFLPFPPFLPFLPSRLPFRPSLPFGLPFLPSRLPFQPSWPFGLSFLPFRLLRLSLPAFSCA